tara:strand:- start:408 stop:656 length:249 start_codon:yes stop_codon:yes gene_type:complete
MIKVFDETTSGSKRTDFSISYEDLTKDEQKEFDVFVQKVLNRQPFHDDITDLDIEFYIHTTGLWRDEFRDYPTLKCKEIWSC